MARRRRRRRHGLDNIFDPEEVGEAGFVDDGHISSALHAPSSSASRAESIDSHVPVSTFSHVHAHHGFDSTTNSASTNSTSNSRGARHPSHLTPAATNGKTASDAPSESHGVASFPTHRREFIQRYQHPVISSISINTTTKDISKTERKLPRKLQSVTSKSDWVDRLKLRYNFDVEIPGHYYASHSWLLGALYLTVRERSLEERQETDTHRFHNRVLEAAVDIVTAYVELGGTCNGQPFCDAARDVTSSLKASAGFRTDDSLILPDHEVTIDVPAVQRWLPNPSSSKTCKAHVLLGEDKTHRVMEKLRPKIDAMVTNQTYRWPELDAIESAPSAVRVLTQVWGQLCAQRASNDPAGWISKLYASSPVEGPGLHCFLKLVEEGTLEVSKWYTDSDSVENTVLVLLYLLEQLFTNLDARTLPSNLINRPSISAGSSAGYSAYRWRYTWPLLFLIRYFWYIITIIGDFIGRPRFNSVSAFLELDLTTQDVRLVHASGQVVVFDEIVGQGAVGTAMRSRSDISRYD
ncbi:hypothetical protein DFH06DRAFT_1348821 [Mycena polygramma]|nr:hypothetical protein DFH06DRAFT_1348821 [Mycena polygramma]